MTFSIDRRSRRALTFALALSLASLLIAETLPGEEQPFRKWEPPAPQGTDARLLHWTHDKAILETTTRQYVALDWRTFSSTDLEYFKGVRVEKQYSPIEPELLKDPIPLFYPSGIYMAPTIPIAFNGRYLTTAGAEAKLPHGSIYAYRDFAPQTQLELLDRFAEKLSVGEKIFAGGPFRESIWITDEKRSLKEIAPDIETEFTPYPEDTFFVGTDGMTLIWETRLEGTPKDPEKHPRFLYSDWIDEGPPTREAFQRYLQLGFASFAKKSPVARVPAVIAAHEKANRGKLEPLGDTRVWKQTKLAAETGAMRGKLILRNAREAVIIREDGCLDIVDFPTAEDAEYLNKVEGFWTPRHDASRPVTYEAKTAPVFARDLAAIFRDYDGDETLIDELEEALALKETQPADGQSYARSQLIDRLAGHVLNCDIAFVEERVAKLREDFKNGKISQAEANRRLEKLQARRVDPTNGDTPAEKLIADWKKRRPESPYPALVAGKATVDLAWKYRGTGTANQVGEDAFEMFGLFCDKAEGEFEEAQDRAENHPEVAYQLLQVGRFVGYPREKMDAIFERGMKADPHNRLIYSSMAMYLAPQWHGEPGDIAGFAASVVRRNRGKVGVDAFCSMYEGLLPSNIEVLKDGTFLKETLSMVAGDIAEYARTSEPRWLYAEMFAFYSDDKAVGKKLIEKAGGIEKLHVMSARGNAEFQDGGDAKKSVEWFRTASAWSGPTHGDAGMADFAKSFPTGVAQNVETSLVLIDGGKQAMFTAAGDQAIVVDLATGEIVRKLSLPKLKYPHLHASRDGATVLLAGKNEDETYYLARIDSTGAAEPIPMKGIPTAGKFMTEILSPDGTRCVGAMSILNAGSILSVWDARTGEKIDEQRFPFGQDLSHPMFDQGGTRLTFWMMNQYAIYDASTKKVRRTPLKGRSLSEGYTLPSGEILLFAFPNDFDPKIPYEQQEGVVIVSSAEESNSAKFIPWPLGSNATNVGLLFSKDGRRFFRRYGSQSEPPSIDVHDLATSERTHRLYAKGVGARAWAYRDSDETIVSIGADGTIFLWDVSEKGLAALAKRKGPIPKAP